MAVALLPDLSCLLSIPAPVGGFRSHTALPVLLRCSMFGTQPLERTRQGKAETGRGEADEYGDDD